LNDEVLGSSAAVNVTVAAGDNTGIIRAVITQNEIIFPIVFPYFPTILTI
jgi:hypothetical protein